MNTKKSVLLTGLTGFIGRHTAQKIVGNYDITAIVRPSTPLHRYSDFVDKVKIVFVDLSDAVGLTAFLEQNSFDIILHIGALRGGRKFSKSEYFKSNISATKILIDSAIKNKSKFIFCSSVGVYGAIPVELPANTRTPFQCDNLYHITKIQCEAMIENAIHERNLNACIVRPSITYGIGDYGFPYTLIKLVDKRLLFLPKKKIYIHLTNVETLAETFATLLTHNLLSGKIWVVADKEKVCFQDLAEFIYKRLRANKCKVATSYPANRFIDTGYFHKFIRIAKFFKSDIWTSRFELLSHHWFYDVSDCYADLHLHPYTTIPAFSSVIDWYCAR